MIRVAVISGLVALPALALQAAQAETFLSLALDPLAGVHAFAKEDTAQGAQADAMSACGALASDCEIVVTRTDLCISLAFDYSNGGFGVYTAETAEVAEREAIPYCASYGNPKCQTVETVCAK